MRPMPTMLDERLSFAWERRSIRKYHESYVRYERW